MILVNLPSDGMASPPVGSTRGAKSICTWPPLAAPLVAKDADFGLRSGIALLNSPLVGT